MMIDDESMPIEVEILGPDSPGAPLHDLTQDISLGDVVVDAGESSEASGCIDVARVRSR
jgi:hypothetical protein